MTRLVVHYVNGKNWGYDIEETILDDYYFHGNSITFDAIDDDGDKVTVIIPFNNVLSIKIYKEEEKMNGKGKRKETDRELLRKN